MGRRRKKHRGKKHRGRERTEVERHGAARGPFEPQHRVPFDPAEEADASEAGERSGGAAEVQVMVGESVNTSAQNTVEIDPQALAAEVASIELPPEDAPAQPAAGEGGEVTAQAGGEITLEQIQAHAVHWKGGADFLVNFLCDGLAPNWGVPQEQREEFAQSGSLALAAWFPDDVIPLKYLLLLNVGTAGWKIVTAQREKHGGKLPPLRVQKPAKTSGGERSGAAQPEAEGVRTGGVTTSG